MAAIGTFETCRLTLKMSAKWGVERKSPDHGQCDAIVKGFGCRPLTSGAACTGGRRPKASKGGNRGKGYVGGAARSMGNWALRMMGLSEGRAIDRGDRRGSGA
jgi:hypothetical protein